MKSLTRLSRLATMHNVAKADEERVLRSAGDAASILYNQISHQFPLHVSEAGIRTG